MTQSARRELPQGTVTLVFTDIEGSTQRLNELGTGAYAAALAEHRRALRTAFALRGAVEVDTQGDAFFFALPTADAAIAAALAAQEALASGAIRVRMGIHTGSPEVTDEGYVGLDVHRAARIASAAHGGQILVSVATAALASDHDMRDLGTHRLRGLASPERLYQLGTAAFPPLATEHFGNLPVPPTPFIGRDAELVEVTGLLGDPTVRLVTVTGLGGAGKTRLAIAAAGRLAESYRDGVWWVSLAPLRDPALVIPTAASLIGAGDDLAGRVGDRQMLILFDNFEHVAAAAADVALLLAACPHLDVLVTSRVPLRIRAEHEYPVPPLATDDAVSLFVARARAAGAARADERPLEQDRAVREICRRLDELPLAIELAAARLKVLSPEQLLGRLDQRLALLVGGGADEPERHRTLRATIEWSYDLLAPAEQELLATLSVFRGGCGLDAAAEICDAEIDGLETLIDHGLLRRRGVRYIMPETIREYGAERLAQHAAATDVTGRHAAFFLALAETAEPNLRSFSLEWLERLTVDLDNLRAALDWLESSGRTQEAMRLAGALQRFWIVRGHLTEGRGRLDRLLQLDRAPTAARGKTLNGAALLALNTGEERAARGLAEEALALHRALGDRWGEARSSFILGFALADDGDFGRARDLFEASHAAFEALGDADSALFVASNLSWAYRELGDAARARKLDEETLRTARVMGSHSIMALSLGGLAMDVLDEGRAEQAAAMMHEALQIDQRLGDVRRSVDDLCRLSRVLAVAGQHEQAATLLAGAEQLHEEIGATVSREIGALNRLTLQIVTEALDAAGLTEAQQRGRALTFADAYRLALPGRDQPVASAPSFESAGAGDAACGVHGGG